MIKNTKVLRIWKEKKRIKLIVCFTPLPQIYKHYYTKQEETTTTSNNMGKIYSSHMRFPAELSQKEAGAPCFFNLEPGGESAAAAG